MRLNSDEVRGLGYRVVDMASTYLIDLPAKPVFQRMQEEDRQAIAGMALPEAGVPAEELLKFIVDRIQSHPVGNGHPRFFG
jgi:hypothetical protein